MAEVRFRQHEADDCMHYSAVAEEKGDIKNKLMWWNRSAQIRAWANAKLALADLLWLGVIKRVYGEYVQVEWRKRKGHFDCHIGEQEVYRHGAPP